ncbi:hypothetical protein DXG01_008328 [Tephrocybe rancida]|nr:hypothetical protein DXG01_008328 [Tephrocybe rancida]
MHNVLQIPELVTALFESLSKTSSTPTIDLLHAALVCRTWGLLALDELWGKHQDAILPLFRCLPPDVWKVNRRTIKLSRDPSVDDCARFLTYAKRMTGLNLGVIECRSAITSNDFLLASETLGTLLVGPRKSMRETFPKLRDFYYHHQHQEAMGLQARAPDTPAAASSPSFVTLSPSKTIAESWIFQAGKVAFPSGIEQRIFLELCVLPRLRLLSITNVPGTDLVMLPWPLSLTAPFSLLEVTGSPEFLECFVQSLVRASSVSALQLVRLRYSNSTVKADQLASLCEQIGRNYTHTLTHLSIHSDGADSGEDELITWSVKPLAEILTPLKRVACLATLEIDPPRGSHPLDATFISQIPNVWSNLTKLTISYMDLRGVTGERSQGMNLPDLLGVVNLAIALPQLTHLNVPFVCVTAHHLPTQPPGRNVHLVSLGAPHGVIELEGSPEILHVAEFIAQAFPALVTLQWISDVGHGQWATIQHLVQHRIMRERRKVELESVASALSNTATFAAMSTNSHSIGPEFGVHKRTRDAIRSFRKLLPL